ncbi:MAG: hypothetical protein JW864_09965 [Spirochaetes bacterium]|nr:hypothetical protein [Spirochaetota bacterium]
MDKKVILDDGKIRIWYYDEFKILYFKFTGLTYGQELIEGMSKGMEVFKENKATKWLSDKGETPTMNKNDLEWNENVFKWEMIKAGWKYWAIVEPDKTSSKMLFDKFIKDYAELNVAVKMFADMESAFNWLKEQP